MKKKVLALLLASAMVASLVGCGNKAETQAPAETESTEAGTTEETKTTASVSQSNIDSQQPENKAGLG